jgi:exodeoxyribonuclease VII large subunit
MPELIDHKQVFTLTEVANSIRKTIADRYTSGYWIKAEINKLNVYAKSGHCFPELVYKNEGKIECEMRATLWKNDFDRIQKNFLNTVQEPLKDGIKVLLFASISYEPKYGLSLIIRDIDPSFSLGELEREKKECIERLQKEGLFGKNKLVPLALLPKRIAVLSVETSKGYQDFKKVMDENIFGYRFFHMLFPAVLQGDASIKTLKNQLNRIKKVKHHFDAVAIIRGGGADVGLSSFNNYSLAKAVSQFPLPVFTGIGHSTNLTVTEMVAYQSAITPTELADFFLQKFHNFAVPVQRAEEIILSEPFEILKNEKQVFNHTTKLFQSLTRERLNELQHELKAVSRSLLTETKHGLISEKRNLFQLNNQLKRAGKEHVKHHAQILNQNLQTLKKEIHHTVTRQHETLRNTEKIIQLVDPMNVVKRGYSITTLDGKLLRSVTDLKEGLVLETLLSDGSILSHIQKIKPKNE